MIAISQAIPTKATVSKLLVGSATMIAAPLLLSYFSPLLREVWVRIGIAHNIETREYELMTAFSADVYLLTAYFSLLAVITRKFYPLLVWFLWLTFMVLMWVRNASPTLFISVIGSIRFYGNIDVF